MAAIDDSVEKLETFCRLLTQVNEDLRADTAAAEERATALERRHAALEDDLHGLVRDLDDADERVEDGRTAATDALEAAADAARDGTARLESEEGELTEAESTFASRQDAAQEAIERSGDEMERDGHAPAMASIAEVEQGLDETSERLDVAFDGLAATLAAQGEEIRATAEEARALLAEEAARVDAEAEAIVHDGTASVAAVDAQLEPFQVVDQASCQEVQLAYQTLGRQSRERVESFLAALGTFACGWAGEVEGAVNQPLTQLNELAGSQGTACAETCGTEGMRVYWEGTTMAGAVTPLVTELEKALQVAPEIAQMLAALE